MKYLRRFESTESTKLSFIKELAEQYLSYLKDNIDIKLSIYQDFITKVENPNEVKISIYKEFGDDFHPLDYKRKKASELELDINIVMVELIPFLEILSNNKIISNNDPIIKIRYLKDNLKDSINLSLNDLINNKINFDKFISIIIKIS